MKIFLKLIIVAILFTATVAAQERTADVYNICGLVIDSLTNDPVPYATVAVAFTEAPAQYVNAVVCDGDGKFEMQLKTSGSYVMTIQSVGINTVVKPFVLTEANKKEDFGKVYVAENVQSIGEVTVSAQRPLVKVEIDKIIYNMEDDPEAKVNNTLEMLRKVPMVTVDGEDKIQLKGASNFRIFINGRPSTLLSGQNVSDVLKSMPANTIRNIEVITDPGAKYDAEGIGGIINIVTSRNLFQGYQGSIMVSTGTFGNFGGSAYLSVKTGKLGLTGSFFYTDYPRPWGKQESESENYYNPQYYKENGSGMYKNNTIYMLGNLEASYEFDTLRLLSLGVNLLNGKTNNLTEITFAMFDQSGTEQYSYKNEGNTNNVMGTTGINLDYQRSTRKKGEYYTLSYQFNKLPNDNGIYSRARDITGEMPLNIRLNQWYDNHANTVEHTGQIDYTNPLNQQHSIEAGLKFILRQNISEVKHYELGADGTREELPSTDNDFEHISNIYAGYAGYAFKAEKFGLRTGVRAEGTMQDVKFRFDKSRNFSVDYYNVVPSITVSYQPKPAQTIRAGYNLRISRPSIWYLNPYVNDTDPYNISYGNPELVPEKSNSFNLNYSYFSTKITLNLSASYSYVNNAIESYTFIDDDQTEVKQQTYKNIGRSQRTGIYVNAGWTPVQKLRLNFNGGLNYADLKSAEWDASNSGLTGNGAITAMLTLPKDFRINANGMYMARTIMLQGEQSGYFYLYLTASKDFLQKKMSVSIMCMNPFTKNLKVTGSTASDYYASRYTVFFPMREIRIGISYRFGNMKEGINKIQRGITNDDVKSGGSGDGVGGVGGVM
jgi:outer membrane receptor protein involved in Fe transport